MSRSDALAAAALRLVEADKHLLDDDVDVHAIAWADAWAEVLAASEALDSDTRARLLTISVTPSADPERPAQQARASGPTQGEYQ